MRQFILIAVLFYFVQAYGQNKFFSNLRQNNYEKKTAELDEARRNYAVEMDEIHEEETIVRKKLQETTFEQFKSFCETSLEQLFLLKHKLGEHYVKQIADIETRYQEKETC